MSTCDLPGRSIDLDQRRLSGEAVRGRDVAAQVLGQHLARRVVERLGDQRPAARAEMAGADHALVLHAALGRPLTRTRPSPSSRSSGRSSITVAARARSFPLSSRAASRAALPPMKVVRLACAPTSQGLMAVSLLMTSTRSTRHAELLGDDHGEDRLRALPDLAGSGEERELAEVVQLQDGAAAVGAVDARAAAHVEHGGIAHAAPPAGARRAGAGARDLPLHRSRGTRSWRRR